MWWKQTGLNLWGLIQNITQKPRDAYEANGGVLWQQRCKQNTP